MGFKPTTLRDLVGCSTTELLGTLWGARVKLWVFTRTASRGYTATCWLTLGTLSNRRRRPDDGNRKREVSFETSLRMYKTL